MNYSTAVFLINSNVRCVICTYDQGAAPGRAFKTLDKTIVAGDYVVVPSPQHHRMAVCVVTEVDVEVDFDSTVTVDWIVAKVDLVAHAATVGMEAQAIATIKSAEVRRKKTELRDALMADSAASIKALPITLLGQALPAPTAKAKRKPKTTARRR